VNDEDVAARLAEALRGINGGSIAPFRGVIADALLPVVREIADQRAAEELEAAAVDWWKPGRPHRPVRDWLRARAAALRGEAGR